MQMKLARLAPARCLIWDPKREFAGTVTTLKDLPARIAAAKGGAFRLVYRPDNAAGPDVQKARFDFLCSNAIAAGNLVLVVDELADVTDTNPRLVPRHWRLVLKEQRHYGLRILAASQRPQHLNKDLWDFATVIRSGRLNYTPSRTEIANVLGVKFSEVQELNGCQWIERDSSGQVLRGELQWQKNRPVDVLRRTVVPIEQAGRPGGRSKKTGASFRPRIVKVSMDR